MKTWPFDRFGNYQDGEIELSRDGLSDERRWYFRSAFLGLRNDPVRFPDGTLGEYVSLHTPGGGETGGVAMLPSYNGKLVLLQTYRHAPRRWEIEAPRGFVDAGEAPIVAARRELDEEYPGWSGELTSVGLVNADSGLFAFDVECFWCELATLPPVVGEHIRSPPILMDPDEILAGIVDRTLHDGFLAFSFLAAMARGKVVVGGKVLRE